LAQGAHANSKVLAKFRRQKSIKSPSVRFLPLAKMVQGAHANSEVLAKFRKFKRIKDTWSNPIGAEADFVHFANSEIFGY